MPREKVIQVARLDHGLRSLGEVRPGVNGTIGGYAVESIDVNTVRGGGHAVGRELYANEEVT